jgi:transposase
MSSIRAAGSLADLQAVYQQHQAILDPLAVAALLNRLAHVWSNTVKQGQHARKQRQLEQQQRLQQQQQLETARQRLGFQAQQEQPQQEAAPSAAVTSTEAASASAAAAGDGVCYAAAVQLLRSLLSDYKSHIPCYSSRQLSSTLWVVGRFHRAAAEHPDIQAAAAAMLDALLAPHTAPNSSEAQGRHADIGLHVAQQQEQQQQQGQAGNSQPLDASCVAVAGSSGSGSTCLLQTCGNAADLQNTMWALGRLAQVRIVAGKGRGFSSLAGVEYLNCICRRRWMKNVAACRPTCLPAWMYATGITACLVA